MEEKLDSKASLTPPGIPRLHVGGKNTSVSETGLFQLLPLNLGPGEMSLSTFSLVSSTVDGTMIALSHRL